MRRKASVQKGVKFMRAENATPAQGTKLAIIDSSDNSRTHDALVTLVNGDVL